MKTARQWRHAIQDLRARVHARATTAQLEMDRAPAGSLALMRHLGEREAFDDVLEMLGELTSPVRGTEP